MNTCEGCGEERPGSEFVRERCEECQRGFRDREEDARDRAYDRECDRADKGGDQ